MSAALALLVASATSAPAAASPPIEWRASLAGQIDGDPHGVLVAALRWGAWSAELNTETLTLAYDREGDGYRVHLGARGELFVSGLMTSPWTAGGKDPARKLVAHHGGLDAELAYYLPHGFYAAGAASARVYAFGATETTAGPAPPVELVAGPTVRVGWWTEEAALLVEGGFDLLVSGEVVVSPRAGAQLRLEPAWSAGPLRVGPIAWGWAALAEDQDRVTLTRVGGLNPYVVPLAGAAWAEWWAEDYVAGRAGLRAAIDHFSLAVAIDGALLRAPLVVDPEVAAWGLAVLTELRFGAFFTEISGGYSPTIPRQGDLPRVSAWARVGLDWTAL